jgi:hypothetical protein
MTPERWQMIRRIPQVQGALGFGLVGVERISIANGAVFWKGLRR